MAYDLQVALLQKYEARLASELSAVDDKIKMYQDAIDKLNTDRDALVAQWEEAVEALGDFA